MTGPDRQLPWSDSCFVCGEVNPFGLKVRFRVVGDEVQVATVVDPRFEGYPGHVHGGVVTALLDETIGWACSVAVRRLFYTAEITVRFSRPVPAGVPILVRGRFLERRRRLLRGEGHIEDGEGTVLVKAEGSFFPVPGALAATVIPQLKMPGRAAEPEDI